MILWEPVPGVCSPDDWKDCLEAMKLVNVISPNVNEAAGFLGLTIDEDLPFEEFKVHVENMAKEFKGVTAVFRCGKHGCLVSDRSMLQWLPAYHQTNDKVVDPTGGGNAFCGGFCAGWVQSGGNVVTAAMYGNIAASFVIEQFGLPVLEYDTDEKWNGDTVKERELKYSSVCTT